MAKKDKKTTNNIQKPTVKDLTTTLLHHKTILYLLFLLLLLLSILLSLRIFFMQRIYPGISIAQTSLSTLPLEQARAKLTQTLNHRASQNLTLNFSPQNSSGSYQEYSLLLTPDMIDPATQESLTQAFALGHHKPYLPPSSLRVKVTFTPKFDSQIADIAKDINKDAIDSKLTVEEDQIIVSPSQEGTVLDTEALKARISDYLNTGTLKNTNLPVQVSYPKLSYQTALKLKQRLDQIKLSPLKLQFKDQSYTLDMPTIISFIDLGQSTPSLASFNVNGQKVNVLSAEVGSSDYTDSELALNKEKVDTFLKTISQDIDQPIQEPLFNFDPSAPQRVKEFSPPQEGRTLNVDKTYNLLVDSLTNPNQNDISLPVDITQPKNKLVNDLGIKELIAQGVSNFAHSIPNRIYNLTLAAQKINGTLIPPNQEFSFNQTVGDITAATGFKQAYVIKSGKTVLDDGGGVCQVSTTLFRAALNAGIPITQRTAHAYRVEYYEQGFPPGIDATTYYPSVDLKFRNDTPAHILIQTRIEGLTLYVDFYGTSDGRISKLTRPVITSTTPALPELRQDDPTLPKGTIKQVDFAAAGANVVFSRTVTRNGQTIINEKFFSNYRPWQAVFLVGTGA